jgi:hypothetical protein
VLYEVEELAKGTAGGLATKRRHGRKELAYFAMSMNMRRLFALRFEAEKGIPVVVVFGRWCCSSSSKFELRKNPDAKAHPPR